MLEGKEIVLGVSGSIAAYKALFLLRELRRLSAGVSVVLTRNAARFVRALSFEALSGREVCVGQFDPGASLRHVKLAQRADLLLVAPATANIIGKFACGIADDLLSTLYLAITAPTLVAPAMNVNMYRHAAVQANIATLKSRGVVFVEPEWGELACGTAGVGRLAAVEVIVARVVELLSSGRPLAGRRLVVTAGPTREPIDAVRFVSNRSSGKMGYALAREAVLRGAEVTLVSGPSAEAVPPGVRFVAVETAEEMLRAVEGALETADGLIMAAAVGDFRLREAFPGKLKKGKDGLPEGMSRLEFVPTEDILARMRERFRDKVLVGFAAEVGDPVPGALEKLSRKGLDLVVANAVEVGFGKDTNEVALVDKSGRVERLPLMPKSQVAKMVLDRVAEFLR